MCVCVCVRERERERESMRDRLIERGKESMREREGERRSVFEVVEKATCMSVLQHSRQLLSPLDLGWMKFSGSRHPSFEAL